MKGKRKLEQRLAAEPKASRGLPPCPDYLVGGARDAWAFWSHEFPKPQIRLASSRMRFTAGTRYGGYNLVINGERWRKIG